MIFYPIILLFFCIIVLMMLLLFMLVLTAICALKRRKVINELNPNEEITGLIKKIFSDSSLYLKRCLRIFSGLLIFAALIFCFIVMGLHSASSRINGLVGTISVIRLELSRNSYVEINPTKLLVRQNGNLNPDLSGFFDGDSQNCSKGGWGIRNGIRYRTNISPFTQRFAIVTLTPE